MAGTVFDRGADTDYGPRARACGGRCRHRARNRGAADQAGVDTGGGGCRVHRNCVCGRQTGLAQEVLEGISAGYRPTAGRVKLDCIRANWGIELVAAAGSRDGLDGGAGGR